MSFGDKHLKYSTWAWYNY